MIAARWVGWSALVFGLVGVGALAARELRAAAASQNASWRDLSFRKFGIGADGQSPAQRDADKRALAACMDAYGGRVSIRDIDSDTRVISVDEASPLAACLEYRQDATGRFVYGGFERPPRDARLHVPLHDPWAPSSSSSFHPRNERSFPDPRGLVLECPHVANRGSAPRVPMDPSGRRATSRARARCVSTDPRVGVTLSVDDAGYVSRVYVPAALVYGAPCVLAQACALRFGDVGGFIWF